MPTKISLPLMIGSFPDVTRVITFINAMSKETDRGKVLIFAGFMEAQLRNVLEAFVVDSLRPKALKELFEGPGKAFGGFSTRTAACHALGLITDDEMHDITRIREIRNKFAHNTDVSYEEQEIKDKCNHFRLKSPDDATMSASAKFEWSAIEVIKNLAYRPHYVRQQRCKGKVWPSHGIVEVVSSSTPASTP